MADGKSGLVCWVVFWGVDNGTLLRERERGAKAVEGGGAESDVYYIRRR